MIDMDIISQRFIVLQSSVIISAKVDKSVKKWKKEWKKRMKKKMIE